MISEKLTPRFGRIGSQIGVVATRGASVEGQVRVCDQNDLDPQCSSDSSIFAKDCECAFLIINFAMVMRQNDQLGSELQEMDGWD